MKFLSFFKKGKSKDKKFISDLYQESLDKFGRDQLKKIVDKGLSIPIVVL